MAQKYALRSGAQKRFIASMLSLFFILFNSNLKASEKQNDIEVSPLHIEFPSAPKNTPYGLVAKLPYAEPAATYRYASDHPDQYAAYWPASNANNGETDKAKGVLVFLHGGCWLSAYDMAHTYAFATGLSKAGYHVWSIEYRRAGNGGEWPVAMDDIKLGLQKISTLQNEGVNVEHISILGHSAGGHLAAMLGVQLSDVLPDSVKLADVIGLAAIVNVVDYANGKNSCQSATPSFMGGMPEQLAAAYYLATPSNFSAADIKLGKFQLMQGDADGIVPLTQASHKNANTIKLEGVGHFDWIHPGSDAFKRLLTQLDANAKSRM